MNACDLLTFLTSKLTGMQDKPDLTKLQEIPGRLLKITIPEHLPHMSIYSKVVFIKNKPFYSAYSEARKLWYGSTQKALRGFSGEVIDPCKIYVVYYTPFLCDFDNYSISFIVNALKYCGCIVDDNSAHLKEGTRMIIQEKGKPRTEIYVAKDNNSTLRKLKNYDLQLEKNYYNNW
jgi:hypothetical protein